MPSCGKFVANRAERAISLYEFALTLPLILSLLFCAFEAYRLIKVRNQIEAVAAQVMGSIGSFSDRVGAQEDIEFSACKAALVPIEESSGLGREIQSWECEDSFLEIKLDSLIQSTAALPISSYTVSSSFNPRTGMTALRVQANYLPYVTSQIEPFSQLAVPLKFQSQLFLGSPAFLE